MALKPGSVTLGRTPANSEWTLSMAKAMEDAFLAEWPIAMPDQPVPTVNDQMRLLFVAIAKGVVKHLGDNGSAFQVAIGTANNHTHTATTTVVVETDI